MSSSSVSSLNYKTPTSPISIENPLRRHNNKIRPNAETAPSFYFPENFPHRPLNHSAGLSRQRAESMCLPPQKRILGFSPSHSHLSCSMNLATTDSFEISPTPSTEGSVKTATLSTQQIGTEAPTSLKGEGTKVNNTPSSDNLEFTEEEVLFS